LDLPSSMPDFLTKKNPEWRKRLGEAETESSDNSRIINPKFQKARLRSCGKATELFSINISYFVIYYSTTHLKCLMGEGNGGEEEWE